MGLLPKRSVHSRQPAETRRRYRAYSRKRAGSGRNGCASPTEFHSPDAAGQGTEPGGWCRTNCALTATCAGGAPIGSSRTAYSSQKIRNQLHRRGYPGDDPASGEPGPEPRSPRFQGWAGPRRSTRRSTRPATPSNAPSTGSAGTERCRPGSTNASSCIAEPSTSPPSESGSDSPAHRDPRDTPANPGDRRRGGRPPPRERRRSRPEARSKRRTGGGSP
jgi:hypothetical protein